VPPELTIIHDETTSNMHLS